MEQKLFINNQDYITYKIIDNDSKCDYDILYLHGFYSSMNNFKAQLLENIAKTKKINLIKLNYLGHGTSSGKVEEFTITDWINNIVNIVDKFCNKKILIVGSSLGGWLSYLIALKYKEKVVGIVTIAGAVDFTTEVIEQYINEKDLEKNILLTIPNSNQNITSKLFIDSKKYNILNSKIDIVCPIILLHGTSDTAIPYNISLKTLKQLGTKNAELRLIKNTEHEFNDNNGIKAIVKAITDIIEKI